MEMRLVEKVSSGHIYVNSKKSRSAREAAQSDRSYYYIDVW